MGVKTYLNEENCCYSFSVQRTERVAAVLPVQDHWLPFSSLDLLLPAVDFGVFFCYKNIDASNNNINKGILKAALAKALVTYYPLAGEVVTNSAGEPELLCNNRGVDFIEAYADIDLRELYLHNPDVSVENKLVPKKDGVLSVQATELQCGGLVIACTFDHRVADAYSANMFLVGWAEIAAGMPISTLPSFRRSLLSARHPISKQSSLDRLYVPLSSLPPQSTPATDVNDVPVNRMYYVCSDHIERMQADASSGPHRRTKLEAFSAYLWQVIGRAAAAVVPYHAKAKKTCRLGIVVDGRSRLRRGQMANYFGNVLSIPYATLGLQELEGMELLEVANVVHEALQEALTEDHFLSLIDWVEVHRPEPALARIYCNSEGAEEGGGPAVVVSSGQRFPVKQMDFGWGKPAFGSYHFPWDSTAGYVMPMPSATGKGWVIYMHLTKRLVHALEAEAGHVFQSITIDEHLIEADLDGNSCTATSVHLDAASHAPTQTSCIS